MQQGLNYNPARLAVELVPRTAWWSNVRSNVTRAEWEKCKRYAKSLTGGVCKICGDVGQNQGKRYAVEAHEIWEYDDDNQIQTLVDIWPLCPLCHKVKHLGRTRMNGNLNEWIRVINHLQEVNGWSATQLERYVHLCFEIYEIRSQMDYRLDVSFLTTIGIDLTNKVLERQ